PISMIDAARKRPARAWTRKVARLVELFASDARVDRLFVHPILKRALCKSALGDRGWLRHVRPWWGHHDHFHVRLACPKDSPLCEPQPVLPPGDGCADLDWWFKPTAQEERDKGQKEYGARVGTAPVLPPSCSALIAPVSAR